MGQHRHSIEHSTRHFSMKGEYCYNNKTDNLNPNISIVVTWKYLAANRQTFRLNQIHDALCRKTGLGVFSRRFIAKKNKYSFIWGVGSEKSLVHAMKSIKEIEKKSREVLNDHDTAAFYS